MLHNFPPLPPNYDGTILIEMPGHNADIAALSWLTVLLQLVVWAPAGTPARGLFLGFLGLPVLLTIVIITSHSHHFTPVALPLSFHVLRQPLRYLAQQHRLNLRVARGAWRVACGAGAFHVFLEEGSRGDWRALALDDDRSDCARHLPLAMAS
jgi:hypothetical protein